MLVFIRLWIELNITHTPSHKHTQGGAAWWMGQCLLGRLWFIIWIQRLYVPCSSLSDLVCMYSYDQTWLSTCRPLEVQHETDVAVHFPTLVVFWLFPPVSYFSAPSTRRARAPPALSLFWRCPNKLSFFLSFWDRHVSFCAVSFRHMWHQTTWNPENLFSPPASYGLLH